MREQGSSAKGELETGLLLWRRRYKSGAEFEEPGVEMPAAVRGRKLQVWTTLSSTSRAHNCHLVWSEVMSGGSEGAGPREQRSVLRQRGSAGCMRERKELSRGPVGPYI